MTPVTVQEVRPLNSASCRGVSGPWVCSSVMNCESLAPSPSLAETEWLNRITSAMNQITCCWISAVSSCLAFVMVCLSIELVFLSDLQDTWNIKILEDPRRNHEGVGDRCRNR